MITPKEKKDLMRAAGRHISIKTRLALLLTGPMAALFPGMTAVVLAEVLFKQWRGLDAKERAELALVLEALVND